MGFGLCLGAAVLLLVAGLREGVVVRRLRRYGTRTRGPVVDNVRGNDSDGPTWAPVIAIWRRIPRPHGY
jgi:hypothetical protein